MEDESALEAECDGLDPEVVGCRDGAGCEAEAELASLSTALGCVTNAPRFWTCGAFFVVSFFVFLTFLGFGFAVSCNMLNA